MCVLSASNLGSADMVSNPLIHTVLPIPATVNQAFSLWQAAFMINCLYRIQNVLTLFEFTDARIEMLDAQVDAHVQTLVHAQAHFFALRCGLEPLLQRLQNWQAQPASTRPPLSQIDGMGPEARMTTAPVEACRHPLLTRSMLPFTRPSGTVWPCLTAGWVMLTLDCWRSANSCSGNFEGVRLVPSLKTLTRYAYPPSPLGRVAAHGFARRSNRAP